MSRDERTCGVNCRDYPEPKPTTVASSEGDRSDKATKRCLFCLCETCIGCRRPNEATGVRFPERKCINCGWKTTSTSTVDQCIKCGDYDSLRPRHFLTETKHAGEDRAGVPGGDARGTKGPQAAGEAEGAEGSEGRPGERADEAGLSRVESMKDRPSDDKRTRCPICKEAIDPPGFRCSKGCDRSAEAPQYEAGATLWNNAIDNAAGVVLAHEDWANDTGRFSESERRLIVGACQTLVKSIRGLKAPTDAQRGERATQEEKPSPIPMFLTCPRCNTRHIDEGGFATKPHHTHSCQECGLTWRPAVVPTVGVQFLPGFKNEAKEGA